MQINKIIFLIILVLIFGYLFYINQSNNITNVDTNNYKTESRQKVQIKQVQKNKIPINESAEASADEPIEFYQESIITTFNIDPIVDQEIISQKFSHCSQLLYFSKTNKYKKNKEYIYSKLKVDKPDYFEKHLNHCKNINLKHPEYSLDSDMKLDDINPTTYLGKFLTNDEFAEYEFEHNIDAIRKAFIDADPNLLLTYYSMIIYYKFVPDLKLTLASQQDDYLVIIGEFARILFACRKGADCGEFSSIVFEKCMINNDMCATSIEELIKTKFSKGQQADIELAYQQLLEYYGIKEL